MKLSHGWSRRNFLRTIGSAVPTLNLMAEGVTPDTLLGTQLNGQQTKARFSPIDLTTYFTASPADFGPRENAKSLCGGSRQDGLIRTPAGKQELRGIPFLLGSEGTTEKKWLVLSKKNSSWSKPSLDIPVNQKVSFLCLAGFCDWDENESPLPGQYVIEKVGQPLAEVVLIYDDKTEKSLSVRRRFEVNAPSTVWGHLSFTSLPHLEDLPRKLTDPLTGGMQWGDLQTAIWDNGYPSGPDGQPVAILWISCMENPDSLRPLKGLRLKAAGDDPVVLCGLTLFAGRNNPLRY